jgi:Protein of unknown function, DUF547
MIKPYYFDRSMRFLLLLPLLIFLTSCATNSSSLAIGKSAGQKPDSSLVSDRPLNSENYEAILKEYVNAAGQVDYENLKNNRSRLDEFNASLASVSPSLYESWTEAEKIAFLVNAYNSLTLAAILDNYPIKSIRDIPGVWDRRTFQVMGQEMTLDYIEHQLLRKQFNEPRVHMALVCASIGCPPLRTEPFTGDRLDEQLDDQTRTFLGNPNNFRIDRNANRVDISSIFQWFGDDFKATYSLPQNFKNLNEKETAVLNFIGQHLSQADRDYLTQGGYRTGYLDYSWSLNKK